MEPDSSAADQSGSRHLAVEPTITQLPERSKRFALVIGVDEYDDRQIGRLEGASNDADALAQALVRYAGFPSDHVIVLASNQPAERRPTRENILRRLSNFRQSVPSDGLLLISFAGHGIARGGRAFLLPSGAQANEDIELLKDTSIDVKTMRKQIKRTGVKQVVILLDACRNDPGGRADSDNLLTEAYTQGFNFNMRNRDVDAFVTIYATEIGCRAYEYTERKQGYFTWALVEGMKGGAANERGEVTLAGLVKYLQEQVPRRIGLDLGQGKIQRPWAEIKGYKADELVISITERASTASRLTYSVDDAAIELEFWNSIKSSTFIEEYHEFLKVYPNGKFAGLARVRIQRLEEAAKKETEARPNVVNPTIAKPTIEVSEPQTYTEIINGTEIEMVRIPAGKFLMGSPESEEGRYTNEGPQHEVTITQPFYMGKYQVTQSQWRAVAKLSKMKIDLKLEPSHFKGDKLPVEQVSWEEAMEFCERLSKATGKTYRLPTEAEWEYACRAGTETPFAFGETITPEVVNYDGNYPYGSAKKGEYRGRTVEVGSLGVANGFGLFDMHGNVWEWCQDWYSEKYYSQSPNTDPRGPDTGSRRVLRGGSWARLALNCRSADRGRDGPDDRFNDLGFRLLRTYN